jgi:hypothetical protein
MRIVILADDCNPGWPSSPIVAYKAARALADVAEVVVITHVRNRENIQKADLPATLGEGLSDPDLACMGLKERVTKEMQEVW